VENVVQVRNKLWRALVRYDDIKQGTGTATDGSGGVRQRIYVLMNCQTSSHWAAIIAAVINLAIITSTLTYIYSSLPEYRQEVAIDPSGPKPAGIFWNDAVCASSLELLLRVISLPDLSSISRHHSIFLDLAALLPWYIRLYDLWKGHCFLVSAACFALNSHARDLSCHKKSAGAAGGYCAARRKHAVAAHVHHHHVDLHLGALAIGV
jgi:hypothetical protein